MELLILGLSIFGLAILYGFIQNTREAYKKAKAYDKIEDSQRLNSNIEILKQQLETLKQENIEEKIDQRTFLSERLKKQKANLEQLAKEHQANLEQLEEKQRINRQKLDEEQRAELETIAKEKSKGFPWLASAYADYFALLGNREASNLRMKLHPALKASEVVRVFASQRHQSEQLSRILKYKLEYYESLFPWLIDFSSEGIDELIEQTVASPGKTDIMENDEDAAKVWLTQAEYINLPNSEKYQIALDRYWKRKKSNWEIGRDYERYVGYGYEQKGYSVTYKGIVAGFEDLGRDLICERENEVKIIQCKYWSKTKQIHEKHIFQLYGTVVSYTIDHPDVKMEPIFVTHTTLSDMAKKFAEVLKIGVLENYDLHPYPCIKCNISRRDGTKIYHLPFDQQYDRTTIEEERNEVYVDTVEKAEQLGFRRAYRWRGQTV